MLENGIQVLFVEYTIQLKGRGTGEWGYPPPLRETDFLPSPFKQLTVTNTISEDSVFVLDLLVIVTLCLMHL